MAAKDLLQTRSVLVWSVALLLAVAACATHPQVPLELPAPGFFFGVIHGFIIAFRIVGSLFMKIRVYAFPNSGFFYDLGFFLGAAAFLGGGGASARR